MKYFLMVFGLIMSLFICGCEAHQDAGKSVEHLGGIKTQDGYNIENVEIICINGVQYYLASSFRRAGLAPVYNQEGRIEICGKVDNHIVNKLQ